MAEIHAKGDEVIMKTCMGCGNEFATVSGIPTLCVVCLSPEYNILVRIDAAQEAVDELVAEIRRDYKPLQEKGFTPMCDSEAREADIYNYQNVKWFIKKNQRGCPWDFCWQKNNAVWLKTASILIKHGVIVRKDEQ